ncbi:hypothetical protein NHX12_026670 [Muraenolepis orangiensis]|uniref:G-protein coupled receptors family 1 profile domain-containing protein n=1 Tax=Muraenolepis orangiensis TaxID=630683 RepID=A0A9Q0EMT5_9TELE|nr:hypothetical protein NHX12_026670 [Muraenolepis orangiensis]
MAYPTVTYDTDWSNASELNYSANYDYDYDPREPCPLTANHSVESALRTYIHPVVCVLGFAGNGLVVLTYTFHRRAKSPTDVYLVNVAASDLLFVAALPLITYNEQWAWPMGTAACKLLRGVYSVNLYSCMLLLACVGADRYLAIVHAQRRFRLRSPLYSRAVCAAVWVLALAFSMPTFLYYQRYRPSNIDFPREAGGWPGGEDEDEDEHVCYLRFSDKETARSVKVLVPAAQMALGFLLPLVVMLFCYARVVATLVRSANNLGGRRRRAVRVVLAVVAVFLACHLPYNVALLCDTLALLRPDCGGADVGQAVLTLTETLAYLHCCLNPPLYAFLGVKFRGHLRKALEELCACVCVARRRRRRRRGSGLSSRAASNSSRHSLTSISFTV